MPRSVRKPVNVDRGAVTVKVDVAAVTQAAQEILDLSPVVAAVKDLVRFKYSNGISWNDVLSNWSVLSKAIQLVFAAVEIVRRKYSSTEGGVSWDLLLEAGANLLDKLITFEGPIGRIVEMVDGPILRMIFAGALASVHGKDIKPYPVYVGDPWRDLGLQK